MAQYIPSSSPRFYFSPEQRWEWIKRERRGHYNHYERINGTFVDSIPVGLFQLLTENKKIKEEAIFIT